MLDNENRIIDYADGVFGVWDYVLFAIMLSISCLIGIFLAWKDARAEKTQTTSDYMLGGRNMAALPVAISLTASFMSSITIIGTPSEFYRFGIMFLWFLVTYMLSGVLVSFTLLPLFYNLGVTSTYEYLEMRFNVWARRLLTIVYILNTIMYCGIVIYAPSLALQQVAGFDLNIAIAVTTVVCIFYTTLGGLKAVIWTDVFQYVFMYIGFISILAYAATPDQFGKFQNIWDIAVRGNRTNFIEFDPDPRIRHSFWTIIFGGIFGLWGGTYGINQTEVQKTARNAVFINIVFICLINLVAGLVGLTMYAYYEYCDPVTAGWVNRWDQLTPYMTIDTLLQFPGVCGLYMASAFAGTLSTASSGMNGCSTVLVQDFIRPFTSYEERTYTLISKVMAFAFGALIMAFAFIVDFLPSGVLQAAMSINGMVMGPALGIFSLGAFFPWVNSTGALTGYVCGLGASIWLYVGSQICPPGKEWTRELDYTLDNCNLDSFPPEEQTTLSSCDSVFEEFYHLSYMYISTLGLFVCLIIGNIVSLITGRQKVSQLKQGVLTPLFHRSFLCKWMSDEVKEKSIPPATTSGEENNPAFINPDDRSSIDCNSSTVSNKSL